MTLPVKTDKEDIDAIVAYLKKKPVGVTVEEAKAAIDSRLLDGRKLSAYRAWGFVTDNGNKLTLSQLGREYAQGSEDDKKKIYEQIIRKTNIYFVTAEWMHNRGFNEIAVSDVATHWYNHFKDDVGTDTEESLNNQVMGFMNIADAAGLGEYKLGRRGQATRLEINEGALKQFIEKSHPDADISSTDETKGDIPIEKGKAQVENNPVTAQPATVMPPPNLTT